ncbi:MAG: MBL fold metallo-hydrolase [Lachnospiraceae bacterium]|nr:MBL fold metallo-hydrolase [Lachnospiraceae bacterium]
MRFMSIASGSSGNCIYVGDENTHILIDAGISKKRIEEGLNTIGLTVDDLSAVFVTHEHIDHIGGLGVLTRKCHAPVYATKGTINGIFQTSSLGKIDREQFIEIREDHCLTVGDITVDSMKISHDAAQPVAYRFFKGDKKIAVATDLGMITEENEEKLKGMDAILLEANHDVNMLQVGPYPYYLKQRILGNRGHLSNENAGRLLSRIVHDDLKHIFLGHLSKENNMPALAYEAVRLEITMGDNPYEASDFSIDIAKRSEPSRVVNI